MTAMGQMANCSDLKSTTEKLLEHANLYEYSSFNQKNKIKEKLFGFNKNLKLWKT